MKYLLVLAALVALSGCDTREQFRVVQATTVLVERKGTGEVISLELSVGHTFRANITPLTKEGEQNAPGARGPKVYAARSPKAMGMVVSMVPHKTDD